MNTNRLDTGRYNVAAMRAVELARREQWDEALPRLRRILTDSESRPEIALPESFLSFLGYGIARVEARYRDGLALCEHAVRTNFYCPDNYYNLARTLHLRGATRRAIAATDRGLALDPMHRGMLALRQEFGRRRSPALRFLSREHWLNRWLGQQRTKGQRIER